MDDSPAQIKRKTKETDITLTFEAVAAIPGLDGSSGVGFLDHMLNSACVHGKFRVTLRMSGDLAVDPHHSTEDIGIVLGMAVAAYLGDKAGIRRFAHSLVPMDESLAMCAVDVSGRGCLVYDAAFTGERIGELDVQSIREFFQGFANNAGVTLHLRLKYGENDHHRAEAMFKAFGRAFGEAIQKIGGGIPSTKGTL